MLRKNAFAIVAVLAVVSLAGTYVIAVPADRLDPFGISNTYYPSPTLDEPGPTLTPPAPTDTPTPVPPEPTPDVDNCPDFDGDGIISVQDLVQVARRMDTVVGDRRYDARFDLNKDGAINVIDLVMVVHRFGESCP